MRSVALTILFLVTGCNRATPTRDLAAERDGLGMAGLAPVPGKATAVRSETVGNMFARRFAIQFAAVSQEIEQFLKCSPRLAGITAEQLTEQHQYLPYDETQGDAGKLRGHATFQPQSAFPWFVPAVRSQGRRYIIPQDAQAMYGEVVVDDANGIVYILVSRS